MYDVHTHFVPPEMLDWLRQNARAVRAVWEERGPGKTPVLTVNHKWSFEFKAEFYEAQRYLQAQTEAGVSRALVSPIPQLFLYDFALAVTAEAATVYNRALAAWVSQQANRLSGLGTVPLQDGEAAARGLEEAMELGLTGVIIGPGTGQTLLGDAVYEPFWQVADARQAVVFIHPLLNDDPRLQRNRMPNLIGVPWETTIAGLDLILSGVLDRYPNVRILLAHGGGFLPYQVGRYNQGYAAWPAVRNTLRTAPEAYLKRFYYDNVLWHPEARRFLTAVVGEERVASGSDYPFDLTTWPPAVGSEAAGRALLG
ncbi:amidohydrolase family protein [Alicyclobacillus cycloheptanicus]|uniref:amidohydrolase family protein n=1 Tax=Alicyclobacillus cycloheptanicus TaxID=1457 RepID=UPI0027D888FF|nr:amidohydrolase family protein [Alicyclobacillus cycloheptanicus]